MATDSDGKLTKFESAVTVVTADFANSIFGGLFGSAEADSMDSDDARVRGHVHDGKHANGHAPKVHLIDHVENKLQHANLGYGVVNASNVWSYPDGQSEAIPEYEIDPVSSLKNYYLDLSIVRSDFTFHEIEAPESADHGNPEDRLIRQRAEGPPKWETADGFDFVIGSESLDDINDPADASTAGDSRMMFDKSKSAFRAGSVDQTQWDDTNRGSHSVAFGYNTEASGANSTVSGGRGNSASAEDSTVGGGDGNEASGANATISGGHDNQATHSNSTVGGGFNNRSLAIRATVAGGYNNQAASTGAVIGGGTDCNALNQYSTVSGGDSNNVNADFATISGGQTNTADGQHASIGGGNTNTADGTASVTAGGDSNDSDSDYAAVLGGQGNKANAAHASIGGGEGNVVDDLSGSKPTHSNIGGGYHNNILDISTHSNISGGQDNYIGVDSANQPSPHSSIGGGQGNNVQGLSPHSTIGGGDGNSISGTSAHSTIGGGGSNTISNTSNHSVVSGGDGNNITDSPLASILSGKSNTVDGSNNSTVCGGESNTVANSVHSMVGSGKNNQFISGATPGGYSGIISGEDNSIQQSTHSTIGSGVSNYIGETGSSPYSSISSGIGNKISSSGGSFVGGGGDSTGIMPFTQGNQIIINSNHSGIVGGEHNIIENGSTHSFIGGGKDNYINENCANSIIVGGMSNNVLGGTQLGAVVCGKGNVISQTSNMSAIISGELNFISSSQTATILNGNGNFIDTANSSIACGNHSKASLDTQMAHASGQFDENYVGTFGGTPTDASGGAGSAQRSNIVAFGSWNYGSIHPGAEHTYELSIGDVGAGGRLSLRSGYAYSYSISGVLNFHGYDNGGASSAQCAISFASRGLFIRYHSDYASKTEVIHGPLSFSSTPPGGGWKTNLSGTEFAAPPGPTEFEFFIEPDSVAGDIIFKIRENNTIAGSPNYSSAVINIELVECGQNWDGA